MGTTEDVAPLNQLLGDVTGDPGAIRATATRWREAATGCSRGTNEVMAAVKQVNGTWSGDSADAFVGYMRAFGTSGDAVQTALTGAADRLDSAAKALEEAAAGVTGRRDSAVTRIDAYRGQPGEFTEDQLRPGIEAIVNEELGLARQYETTANGRLQAAMSGLDQAAGDLNEKFAAMRLPGEQEFVPARGGSWVPMPDVTTASGDGSGSGTGDGATGFGGYGASGPPPGGSIPAPKAEVVEWIKQALAILRDNGYQVSPDNPADIEKIWTIIHHESGGNPNAINLWDSNAAKGIPSKGLMQTIDPTFNGHALPGHGNIWNPVDNIIAGVRYTFSRYGSLNGHPGIDSLNNGGGYQPY